MTSFKRALCQVFAKLVAQPRSAPAPAVLLAIVVDISHNVKINTILPLLRFMLPETE